MSNQNKKTALPKLRFPEFQQTEKWEEKKLKDYLELLTDFEANGSFADVKKNVKVFDESNFAWYVRATDLENDTTLEKVKYVDQKGYNFLRKTALFGGELLVAKRGEIGKLFFFETKKNVPATVAPNLYLLKMNGKAVPKFFFYFFSNTAGNQLLKRLNASSTIGALYKDDVKNIKLYAPSFGEQQKIAATLSSLDDLLTAQSAKLEALKAHKRGLMQGLFPAEGETVPKLRFPEFQDAEEWDIKPLGEVAKNLDSKRVPITESERISDNVPYYGASGIIDYVQDYLFDEDLLCISEDGANLMARTYPIAFSIAGKTWVNNHAHVIRFKRRFTQVLVENYLNSISLEDFLTGMAQPKLNRAKLDIIPIPLPKDEAEQQKIADCLSSLDNRITAQSQKIEALKLHKKGLMQHLFPAAAEPTA